jgi:LDH2 family malate/lactate/ureidoglycolate dehydrogenase
MFEEYKVPEAIAIRLPIDAVRMSIENIFQALDVPKENAKRMADVLLYADIHGIDSHGISHMMQWYTQGLEEGWLNGKPEWKAVRDAPGVTTLDGDKGIGLDVGPQAMDLAMDKADTCGIGAVAVTNCWHFGAAGYYAKQALERDMVGIAMTSSGLYVTPTFGAKPLLGTNPIAVGAPTRNEIPFVFDASTSSVAMNKVALTKRNGGKVPPGWIARSDGTPIMEQSEVPEDHMLLPLGGTREVGSHKGYGLAVMVDILTSLLSGCGPRFEHPNDFSHHFTAYRIDAFTDLEEFKDHMDAYMKVLRECPPAPGHDRVIYAGMPEKEAADDRRANGIPYHPDVVEWHHALAEKLEVEHCFGNA